MGETRNGWSVLGAVGIVGIGVAIGYLLGSHHTKSLPSRHEHTVTFPRVARTGDQLQQKRHSTQLFDLLRSNDDSDAIWSLKESVFTKEGITILHIEMEGVDELDMYLVSDHGGSRAYASLRDTALQTLPLLWKRYRAVAEVKGEKRMQVDGCEALQMDINISGRRFWITTIDCGANAYLQLVVEFNSRSTTTHQEDLHPVYTILDSIKIQNR